MTDRCPMNTFIYNHPFTLECGAVLPRLEVGYHTFGELSSARSNVVWICHALTANSDPTDWWNGLVGEGCAISPERYFIVCANIIGSCYGSSGPLSLDPEKGASYFASFPLVTIRDMVKAHRLLADHLGIGEICLGIGGSMGGYQVMEWAVQEPARFAKICLLATSAKESPWGVAIHEAQRLAIEADPTWREARPDAGAAGMRAARGIGMLTYRNYTAFGNTQADEEEKLQGFKAASYIRYQGEKLVKRFNAQSYHLLTRAMDSHDVGRDRGGAAASLEKLTSDTLVIGISSDILCPVSEQQFLARSIPTAHLEVIDSPFGHDGFLVETSAIAALLTEQLRP
jgi:homoserine O-acetyltransferase/O-succinyltransferase